jgi:hypothetical protein
MGGLIMNATKFILNWIEEDWRLAESIALKTCDYFGSFEDLGQITNHLANDIRKTFSGYIHDKSKDNLFMVSLCEEFLSNVEWHSIASDYVMAEAECIENFKE